MASNGKILTRADTDPAVSPYVLAMRDNGAHRAKPVMRFDLRDLAVEISASGDSLWAYIRRLDKGGVALRIAFCAGEFTCARIEHEDDEIARLVLTGALGTHRVILQTGHDTLENLRVTVMLTPAARLLMPFMPRDLYPMDAHDDPLPARGQVLAAQRGLNAGLVYFRLDQPEFGNVLYFQNLTAMNDYYRATRTTPDGAVGGVWPELGYLIPAPPQSGTPPADALECGREVTISDAIVVFHHHVPTDERQSARQFLQMLGVAYRLIDTPAPEYRDWMTRSEWTLRDLDQAPEATIDHYGHRYVHPYTAAEYPDIMVQVSLIAAIHDWGKWHGQPHPLEARFKAGLHKFHDPKLHALRRYLPNVGDDKNADAVDSWYLYHPMLNLARMALDGDQKSQALLQKTVDFGIKAAHHFAYKWPVQYNITDFSVITQTAPADGRGQTDVGGIYAWLMLQMFALTDEKRFLDEAQAAIDASLGLGFNVNFQANLTAWGAAACMRLWRITNQPVYLEQSYVYLASFFHNCAIWESEIDLAAHYRNFFGVTCLQDAPYMSIYECFDSYTAFECYLDDSGPDLDPAARMLIAEYCKYALDRAWFFYPDALPPAAISPAQRATNGHVDRTLSFPLEDLYVDGQVAGQVGQEIYGAGAAFVFATRAFHRVEGAPFHLYCDHFVRAIDRTGDRTVTITLDGGDLCSARLSLVRLKRRKLGKIIVGPVAGDRLGPQTATGDRIEYIVPARGRLILTWE